LLGSEFSGEIPVSAQYGIGASFLSDAAALQASYTLIH
jgi:hypothetical protein